MLVCFLGSPDLWARDPQGQAPMGGLPWEGSSTQLSLLSPELILNMQAGLGLFEVFPIGEKRFALGLTCSVPRV